MPSNPSLSREQREQVQRLAAEANSGSGCFIDVVNGLTNERVHQKFDFTMVASPELVQAYEAALVAAEHREARLQDENRVLLETADMPIRQKRIRLHMDRVEWDHGEWALHYCVTRSIHQGSWLLWQGTRVIAVGSREWCDKQFAALAVSPVPTAGEEQCQHCGTVGCFGTCLANANAPTAAEGKTPCR